MTYEPLTPVDAFFSDHAREPKPLHKYPRDYWGDALQRETLASLRQRHFIGKPHRRHNYSIRKAKPPYDTPATTNPPKEEKP